jgi:hypothetical protein
MFIVSFFFCRYRTSKRVDYQESEKENVKQPPLSLLEDVNKWKKARITSIRLRKELPPFQPLAVCFSLPDNAKPHHEVKSLMESQVGTPVTRLQFDPVAVHSIESDVKSRWIVTLSNSESRDVIVDCIYFTRDFLLFSFIWFISFCVRPLWISSNILYA